MRLKGRKILTACSILVLLWIVYIAFTSIKQKMFFAGLGQRNDIHDVIKYIPSGIRNTVNWDSSRVPVVVVEEHHEVIPYWFAAAESNIIPKDSVTILHVDGHSDAGAPVIIPNFPLFHWPRSLNQMFTLMQKNDVFVVGAGLTGMVNRFIWVWPPWDKVNHEDAHVSLYVEAGSTVKQLKSGEEVLVLCGCVTSLESDRECYMTNYTHLDSENYIPIDESECSFSKNVSGIYEEISEDEAIKLMAMDKWINPIENVILDIDEDYYGCESVGSKINKAGIQSFLLDNLATLVNKMFCSESVSGEIIADNFYHSIIKMITTLKINMLNCRRSSPSESLRNKCVTYVGLQQEMFKKIPDLVENLNNYKEVVLCSDYQDTNLLLLQGILRNLIKLTIKQLRVLSNVGICLSISPKTLGYEPPMRLCTSYNTPNSSQVLFYSPTAKDIKKRTEKLQTLFANRNLSPKFITITRSVRDGYTPREHSFQIEADLMKLLNLSFLGVDRELVHFDVSLLGGKEGWSKRH